MEGNWIWAGGLSMRVVVGLYDSSPATVYLPLCLMSYSVISKGGGHPGMPAKTSDKFNICRAAAVLCSV